VTTPTTRPYAPTPGPADRELFFDAQRRHRRASHRYMLLAVVAVALSGIPLSLVVTPAIFLVVSIGLHVAALAGAPVSALDAALRRGAMSVLPVLEAAADGRWPPLGATLGAAVPLVAPGAAAMLALWLAVRRLLARAGAGGVLLALRARPPVDGDFEELQLGNLVEEMAIAAGLPAPQFRVLDSPAANAAAVGTSPHDATLVVSRGLLDQLDRDQTQGVIADLVASVGDGDLHIAGILLSVDQALGLLLMVLNAPFGPRSRHALWQMVRAGFGGGDAEEEAALVANLLAEAPEESDDDVDRYETRTSGRTGTVRSLFQLPVIPVLFLATSAKMIMLLTGGMIFGPVLGAVWRRRRRLADAMAVQLTRNPDGLARALERLQQVEHHPSGGRAAAHLFVVWEPVSGQQSGSFAGATRITPSVDKRCQALRRMGATSVPTAVRGRGFNDLLSVPGLILLAVLVPLALLMVAALGFVVVALVGLNFVFLGLLLAGLTALIDVAFGLFGS
jgi:Zn-dependent protease with chaperone function